ncbi:MAG: GNAT family N-acetyltransferase [Terriglobales bacterium]|jgi:CelD/BcsL family acetyltransferase involved in cellulose biosynthesis
MSLELEVIPSIAACETLKPEWVQLHSSCPQATVFNTFGWIKANLLAFPNRETWILVFRQSSSSLAAVVPLVVRGGRRYFRERRWVEFAGQPYADYDSCLVRPGHEAAVAESLVGFWVSKAASWDGIFLDRFKACAPFVASLASAAKSHGLSTTVRESEHIRRLTREEFGAEGLRSGHASKSLRKARNRLQERGDVRFEVYGHAAQIHERLEMFFTWHVERFAAKGQLSPLADPQHRDFYRRIVEELAPLGHVWLSVLSCGDVAIAMKLTPLFAGTLHLYSTCFNEAFARYSPSMLQLELLLEHAFRSGISCVDFGIGESPQKDYASADIDHTLTTLEIYRERISPLEGRLYQAAGQARSQSRLIPWAGRLFRRFFPYNVR